MDPPPRSLPLLLLALAACGDADLPARRAAREAPGDGAARTVRSLEALGYAGSTDREGEEGVTLRDAARMQPGYTLYSVQELGLARLVDEEGRVVRTWRDPDPGVRWYNVELTGEGELLTTGTRLDERGRLLDDERYALRLSWDGDVVWKRALPCHHALTRNPAGGFVTLSAVRRRLPELAQGLEMIDNGLLVLDEQGRELREVSLYDALVRGGDFRYEPMRTEGGRVVADFLHCNTVSWRERPGTGEGGPRTALVTSRHQHLVAAIDVDRGVAVWTWGPGELEGPHDARFLDNGNVLVFDNGLFRGWSRVVEVDPESGAIVWSHPDVPADGDPGPARFHSASRGSCQRLANGDTLLCVSDEGLVLEVTPEHDTVWRFVSPERLQEGGEERRATLVGAYRIPRDLVARLEGRR